MFYSFLVHFISKSDLADHFPEHSQHFNKRWMIVTLLYCSYCNKTDPLLKQNSIFWAEHKSKTLFPSLEQLCSSGCTREPSAEHLIPQFLCISSGDEGSAEAGWYCIFLAACPVPGIPPGPHSRALGRVWILASLQRLLPSQTVNPIFWCRCVWCLISMYIFGCYFLCMY